MSKVTIVPNTTLYPVAVVLVTCGAGEDANIITVNRAASCNAEPPMIAISIRRTRASHDLVDEGDQFVVNIPSPDMELVSDYVGTVSTIEVDKWVESGLTPLPAAEVDPPLIAECPVHLECQMVQKLRLPSHTLFVGEVVAIQADEDVVGENGEIDFNLAKGGLVYRAAAVREKPVDKFRPEILKEAVRSWREQRAEE